MCCGARWEGCGRWLGRRDVPAPPQEEGRLVDGRAGTLVGDERGHEQGHHGEDLDGVGEGDSDYPLPPSALFSGVSLSIHISASSRFRSFMG